MVRQRSEKMIEKSFEEIFEELARHNDRSIIWNNWLEYVIDVNLLKLEPENKEEFKKKYYGNEESYVELMGAWLNELTVRLETYPYYDMLGEFYEELIQSKSKKSSLGQAYTPPSVTNLLSEICIDNDKNYINKIANDPACGSARTLLSAHVQSQGEIFVMGADLDRTSCLMAVANLFSQGCRGSILHMDTLEQTFYEGWRINKYLYHGIPIPHIEIINNPDEAYDFIELHRFNNKTINDSKKDNKKVEVVESPVKPSGQTTLI